MITHGRTKAMNAGESGDGSSPFLCPSLPDPSRFGIAIHSPSAESPLPEHTYTPSRMAGAASSLLSGPVLGSALLQRSACTTAACNRLHISGAPRAASLSAPGAPEMPPWLVAASLSLLVAVPAAANAEEVAAAYLAAAPSAAPQFEPRGITPEDTFVFVLGCVPFIWAGVEFWRRIAVGDPFGTGRDSVIINDTSGNRSRAVRRVLGRDAIIAAQVLFALAFASGALVLLAGIDVVNRGG